ncbi:MAG: hypothetical protein IT286_01620 [Proteobacteria bacterium]|jgi:hypothetical protein|nr:hypothetical protein [Pseudomonadota bacterium]
MKIEYCMVGHVTIDKLESKQQPGGSVLFGGYLASCLGFSCGVVTASDVHFPYAEYSDVEWSIQFSAKTTTQQHRYVDGQRISKGIQKSDPILASSVGKALRNAKVVMLAPVEDEIHPDLISLFPTPWIGLTPQGWFREYDAEGNMRFKKSSFDSLPKKIKLIVVSKDDMANDPDAWTWIKKSAEVAVCTMGKEGYILAYGAKEQQFAPVEVMKEVNPTGSGDIFATSLLLLLSKGFLPEKACELAGKAAGTATMFEPMKESVQAAARTIHSVIKAVEAF